MARAKITYAAPSWRDPITDAQIVLFCQLVDDLAEATAISVAPSPATPEYQRLMMGAEACGVLCCDLTADPEILIRAEKAGWVEKAKFKDLRHYLHSLIRAERQFQKNPRDTRSPLQGALENQVLPRVCDRLRRELSWRGL